jgi:hypothetical protein
VEQNLLEIMNPDKFFELGYILVAKAYVIFSTRSKILRCNPCFSINGKPATVCNRTGTLHIQAAAIPRNPAFGV